MATKTKKSSSTRARRPTKKQLAAMARAQLMAVMLLAVGVLLACLSLIPGESGWHFLHEMMFGLFGWPFFLLGPTLVYICLRSTRDEKEPKLYLRLGVGGFFLLLVCAMAQIFGAGRPEGTGFWGAVAALYRQGQMLEGGGVFAVPLGLPLMLLGRPGDRIVIVLALFASFMTLTGTTLRTLLAGAQKPVQKISQAYQQKLEQHPPAPETAPPQEAAHPRRMAEIDIPLDPTPPLPRKAPDPTPACEGPGAQEAPEAAVPLEEEPGAQPDSPAAVPEEENPPLPGVEDIIHRAAEKSRMARQVAAAVEATLQAEEAAAAAEAVQPAGEEPPGPEEDVLEGQLSFLDMPDEGSQAPAGPQAPPPAPPRLYRKPPIELLRQPAAPAQEDMAEELRQNAELLVDTLKSFGVQTRIIDISRGPTVTRYELQPSAGVKISRITGLADDIALNLASAGVRIEAPIPNKAAVGIEVPNKKTTAVTLREVIEAPAFEQANSSLTVALGRDISGSAVLADIGKMPHLLIAGATGSGKSVCINAIIMSLLYKSTPDQVKFLMVDPKVVELGVYNGLPHLLVPVVTDPRKAAGALGWAVSEMLKRYQLFAQHGVRDLSGFNKLAGQQEGLAPLPQVVIIIDELSDLMMAAPNEVEDSICRLAQMARAAGMHLIIATQRPSVDVITGVIKANIPSRIAFAVSSQVDSRTILDMGGAEKLLGMGDMLFAPVGASKPRRVQGCYVSDEEIERVTGFIKEQEKVQYSDQILEEIDRQAARDKSSGDSTSSEAEDEMLPAAIECVVETGVASTSLLQRRLKLGYARAGRIIDELEARGIIGPYEGSKPRQVRITREQWLEMKLAKDADASQGRG